MHPASFDALDAHIRTALPDLHTLTILQDGDTLFERGYHGHSLDELADIKSVTKSIVSALIGIAIGRGELPADLDTPLLTLLPQYAPAHPDPRLAALTLRHCLTMTSGLRWQEFGLNYRVWLSQEDPVRYTLHALDFAHPPGTRFNYSTAVSHLLSAVLTQATGAPARDYAIAHLFNPLGLEVGEWPADRQGRNVGGAHLHLSARGLAAFGELYRNAGVWRDRQLVPADWVRESLTAHARGLRGPGYGYQWWLRTAGPLREPVFFAAGHGGQYVFVVPARKLTVVITARGDLKRANITDPAYLLDDYILPALSVG